SGRLLQTLREIGIRQIQIDAQMRETRRAQSQHFGTAEWRLVRSPADADLRKLPASRSGFERHLRTALRARPPGVALDSQRQRDGLPDTRALLDFGRIGQTEWSAVSFVGGVGPIPLILHLE